MFVRAKKSGAYHYLQLVHNQRVDGHVRQSAAADSPRGDGSTRCRHTANSTPCRPPADGSPNTPPC